MSDTTPTTDPTECSAEPGHHASLPDDDMQLLDTLQRAAFDYFPANTAANGLITDTSRDGSPISIAVVGMALSCYPVAVQRGWIDRGDALARCLAILRFFRDSEQGDGPEVTGYKGFYYHFLDADTGLRTWKSELSMIDSALLIAGMLTAAAYFDADDASERELRDISDALYRRVDWAWSQNGGATIVQGWKPESGFLHYGWEGYSEAIVLYALAMGSPTHPIDGSCYEAWTLTYQWENLYGHDFLYAGPLFVHQFSHAWVDLRGIRDAFMREKDCDYFDNSRRAVAVQRDYTRGNPMGHSGFDEDCWGLSAGDGPTDSQPDIENEPRQLFGYAARGVPYGPDDGTLSPPAVLASVVFEPQASLRCLRRMIERYPHVLVDGRLSAGLNPGVCDNDHGAWTSAGHYGLDQGMAMMMIENHRSGLIWELMRCCQYLVDGLTAAGFRGGWLRHARKAWR